MSLFLHFTVNPKPPVGFLDVPRCSMTGKEQTVGRYQQIESRWGYSGKCLLKTFDLTLAVVKTTSKT